MVYWVIIHCLGFSCKEDKITRVSCLSYKTERLFQGCSSVVVLCCLFPCQRFWWRLVFCVFISFLVRFALLGGHILGKSCSLGWPYILSAFFLFEISVISHFGFVDWIWLLFASVAELSIIFTYNVSYIGELWLSMREHVESNALNTCKLNILELLIVEFNLTAII